MPQGHPRWRVHHPQEDADLRKPLPRHERSGTLPRSAQIRSGAVRQVREVFPGREGGPVRRGQAGLPRAEFGGEAALPVLCRNSPTSINYKKLLCGVL